MEPPRVGMPVMVVAPPPWPQAQALVTPKRSNAEAALPSVVETCFPIVPFLSFMISFALMIDCSTGTQSRAWANFGTPNCNQGVWKEQQNPRVYKGK